MIKQNSGNVMIAVLAVVVMVGIGFWYVSTQRDVASTVPTLMPILSETTIDTSDWKRYTNQKYGFSINHPDTFYLYLETTDPEYWIEHLITFRRSDSTDYKQDGSLGITILGESLEQRLNRTSDEIVQQKEMNIRNLDVTLVDWVDEDYSTNPDKLMSRREYFITTDFGVVEISGTIYYGSDKHDSFFEDVDLVARSFQLTSEK